MLWYKGAMNKSALAILPLAGLLLGCQPAEEELPDHGAAGTLAGGAFYFERIAMPADASLEAVLLDTSGPGERVLIRQVFDDVGSPPYTFELTYDPAGVDPDDDHELWLTLYMPDGSARFSAETAVDLSQSEIPQVTLIAIDPEPETVTEEAAEPEPEPETEEQTEDETGDEAASEEDEADLTANQDWQCGDTPVEAIFDGRQALLTLPWTDVILERTEAASGARFASGNIELWVRGDDHAMLTLPGQERISCSPTNRTSPWAMARDAGAFFRATGNEPGWVLELYDRDSPVLRLELDSGTRELYFDTVIEDPDGDGYIAESPGNHAGIILIRQPCRDSMVGWEFPYRVEMLLNDEELTACGRYL